MKTPVTALSGLNIDRSSGIAVSRSCFSSENCRDVFISTWDTILV